MSWLFAFRVILKIEAHELSKVRVIKFGICECNEIDIIGCTMYTMRKPMVF
jgi:hypothetical protein